MQNNASPRTISAEHDQPIGAWSEAQLRTSAAAHCVNTWTASKNVPSLPIMTHGDGVYLYDTNGKEFLDWTSQAVCTNLGHTVPHSVQSAIAGQLERLPMVYGGMALTEVRVRLSQLLAEICPGDINGFLFTCGGGEANEAAMRMAKRYTGRHKIVNQYRSYHGGSTAALCATGDFRRWYGETGNSGFVKTFNPQPFGFRWGSTDEERTNLLLLMLEEQIQMEGPESVAAIMIETIVGAGGVLVPPKGYVEGVRALCDNYGIMLIMDEVMVGVGRTGKMWCLEHFEGVVPDILTAAKGISAAFLPVGMVGMRQPLKDFFTDNPLGWGATYANHPVGMACAYEVLKYCVANDIPGKAAALEPVMVEEMSALVEQHKCVRQARAVGLFGCLDLVDTDTGRYVQTFQQPMPAKVAALKSACLEQGLFGLFRPPLLHCSPPLIINEEQLRDGFARLDRALYVLDQA